MIRNEPSGNRPALVFSVPRTALEKAAATILAIDRIRLKKYLLAMQDKIEVVPYDPAHRESFRTLNLAWIRQYFHVEKKDIDQVNNPEDCLKAGGQIFFALRGGEVAGTCAAYSVGPGQFEIAKMAVDPASRGLGIGDRLMEEVERWIRQQGAEEIVILSNTVLEPAIKLYQKHHFQITHLGPHPDYERCNIELRKRL